MSFINSFRNQFFTINDSNFPDHALSLFQYQAKNNPIYNSYLNKLQINPIKIKEITEIPFLPISFFKTHKVLLEETSHEIEFYSSGTTGVTRSTHYLPDLNWYHLVSRKIFETIYHPLNDCIILAFLPSYQENPSSSLISMVNDFIQQTNDSHSGFINAIENLESTIANAYRTSKKVILFGVTYALLDFAEKGIKLPNISVIETGGMKGRRKEITREDLHKTLKSKLGISNVHSEYGMTELLSQAYSLENGNFVSPPWMRISTREVNDPFQDNSQKRTGILKVIDLANIYSCAFIETEDLGMVNRDESFTVLGRMDNSDIRGCNLLYS